MICQRQGGRPGRSWSAVDRAAGTSTVSSTGQRAATSARGGRPRKGTEHFEILLVPRQGPRSRKKGQGRWRLRTRTRRKRKTLTKGQAQLPLFLFSMDAPWARGSSQAGNRAVTTPSPSLAAPPGGSHILVISTLPAFKQLKKMKEIRRNSKIKFIYKLLPKKDTTGFLLDLSLLRHLNTLSLCTHIPTHTFNL